MPSNQGARLWVRTSSFEHAIDSAGKLIQAHPFNRKLQLILPASQHQAQQVFDVSAFYYAIRVNLAGLAELACVSSLSDGALSAVCLDRSQTACLAPDQHLHLLVSTDQHRRLGIRGARVDRTDSYHVKINSASSKLVPGSQQYNRAQDCLRQGTNAAPFLCVRATADNCVEIQPTHVSGAIDAECLAHQHQNTTMPDIMAPTQCYLQQLARTAGSVGQSSEDSTDADANSPSLNALHDLYEWIGATSCSISGDWVGLQEHHMEQMDVHRHTWTGLLAPYQVRKALEHCQQLVAKGDCPWAILCVWGFTGQPISWLGSPVNSPESGENDYSIVILPQKEYMLMVASGQGDSFQTI